MRIHSIHRIILFQCIFMYLMSPVDFFTVSAFIDSVRIVFSFICSSRVSITMCEWYPDWLDLIHFSPECTHTMRSNPTEFSYFAHNQHHYRAHWTTQIPFFCVYGTNLKSICIKWLAISYTMTHLSHYKLLPLDPTVTGFKPLNTLSVRQKSSRVLVRLSWLLLCAWMCVIWACVYVVLLPIGHVIECIANSTFWIAKMLINRE